MTSEEDIKRLFGGLHKVGLPARVRGALAAPALPIKAYKDLLREMLEEYCPDTQKKPPQPMRY